jgi:hypothetical protein
MLASTNEILALYNRSDDCTTKVVMQCSLMNEL